MLRRQIAGSAALAILTFCSHITDFTFLGIQDNHASICPDATCDRYVKMNPEFLITVIFANDFVVDMDFCYLKGLAILHASCVNISTQRGIGSVSQRCPHVSTGGIYMKTQKSLVLL